MRNLSELFKDIQNKSLDKNMNLLNHVFTIYQLQFYKTWVFMYGTSVYALDKELYFELRAANEFL